MQRLFMRGRLTMRIGRPLIGPIFRGEGTPNRPSIWVAEKDSACSLSSEVLAVLSTGKAPPDVPGTPVVRDLPNLDDLDNGDVVRIDPSGSVYVLYRIRSRHNTILATQQCNSFCVMCSQPPKKIDDSYLLDENLRLVELMDPVATKELGITGGEPTLLGKGLLQLIKKCRDRLADTALHLLSNGRMFCYSSYAREMSEICHPDLLIGIPLYSDLDWEHDHVVQAAGSYHQTLLGMHNLGRYGVRVEVRLVIHQHTFRRLPQVAEFIYWNLPFVSHVALMGLEPMGFAVGNLDRLWIDPLEYRPQLTLAVQFLAARGIPVSIYNHQLCLLARELWPYARKSISDWKNDYLPICGDCDVKSRCGGFFVSSIRRRYSEHIKPIKEETPMDSSAFVRASRD